MLLQLYMNINICLLYLLSIYAIMIRPINYNVMLINIKHQLKWCILGDIILAFDGEDVKDGTHLQKLMDGKALDNVSSFIVSFRSLYFSITPDLTRLTFQACTSAYCFVCIL